MPSVTEAMGAKGALAAALAAGVSQISRQATVTFTPYTKQVMPLDGYVFWVKASLIADNPQPTEPTSIEGSLHYTTKQVQSGEEVYSNSNVVFTCQQDIPFFMENGPTTMYIGEFDGMMFSFSERGPFYTQSDLYHYRGDAVYPFMLPQIITDAGQIDTTQVIVSNSLPIWLSVIGAIPGGPPVYPAYLVPDNLPPPYATVNIDPATTTALQMAPYIDASGSHWQLMRERVTLNVYGIRHDLAMTIQEAIIAASLTGTQFGILNNPAFVDDLKGQNEINALAMKKRIVIDVSYYQTQMRDLSIQLITQAIPTFLYQ